MDDSSKRPEPVPSLANVARGRWGERRAADHYRRNGFVLLDTNWRVRDGEIDLIVGRPEAGGHRLALVVFVEVKARRTDRHGSAAAAVTPLKQRRLRAVARQWLAAHRSSGAPPVGAVRFDVVAITGNRFEVIESAF